MVVPRTNDETVRLEMVAAGAGMTSSFFVASSWTRRRGLGGAALRLRVQRKNPGAGRPGRGGERDPLRVPPRSIRRERALAGEDPIELLLDLHFLRLRRDGDLLDEQRARRVEHLALAERQLLVTLEPLQVAEDLGDLEDGARLDLLHVLAVATVPRLTLDRDLAALEDLEDLVHLVGADELAQADGAGVACRDHDLHPVLEDLEDVKRLLVPRDLTRLDPDDLGNAMGRIDR